jgi:hypothetical protein
VLFLLGVIRLSLVDRSKYTTVGELQFVALPEDFVGVILSRHVGYEGQSTFQSKVERLHPGPTVDHSRETTMLLGQHLDE